MAVNCIEAAEAAASAKSPPPPQKKTPPPPPSHERLAPSTLASAKFPSNLRHCKYSTSLNPKGVFGKIWVSFSSILQQKK